MHLRPSFFALLAAAIVFAGCEQKTPAPSRLENSQELFQAAADGGGQKLFVNPMAQPAFSRRPGIHATVGTEDAAAVRSPEIWRRLDRSHHYSGVLLAGSTAEFFPLLNHLAGSPDFRLAWVNNWGVLFVRGRAIPYAPPDVESVAKKFSDPEERGTYLAQMALMLDAAGKSTAARDYLAAAMKGAPDNPAVHVAAATTALRQEHFSSALQASARALSLDPRNAGALEVQAQALAKMGAKDEAWMVAKALKAAAPEDLNALFLHARLANAAHAYSDEQASLEDLVRLAIARKVPAADYRVYLGQCYARQGLARPALEQFDLALREPNLSDQQRRDLETAQRTVRERTGALSN